MKWFVVFMILKQVCSPVGTGHEAPPYFYMSSFDSREEAVEFLEGLDETEQGFLGYGFPGFTPTNREIKHLEEPCDT